MTTLGQVPYKGRTVYVNPLEKLKTDNEYYGRPERVALIEERMKHNIG